MLLVLRKYLQKYGRQENLMTYCPNTAIYNQKTIERWTKGSIFPFPKKGDLRIAKNYRSIFLSSVVAKVYNAFLQKYIQPEIEKILRKNQNGFQRKQSATSLTSHLLIRWTRHVRHDWRSKDTLISNVLLWTPAHMPVLVDQQELKYNSSVWTQDVVKKTCWK